MIDGEHLAFVSQGLSNHPDFDHLEHFLIGQDDKAVLECWLRVGQQIAYIHFFFWLAYFVGFWLFF